MLQLMIDFPAQFPGMESAKNIILNVDMRRYTNVELLNTIIGSNSKEILASTGNSLNQLAGKNMHDLLKIKGLGPKRALQIMATLELGKRRHVETPLECMEITSSAQIFTYFYSLLADLPHEEFWILSLTRKNKIIASTQVSKGGISGTFVDPKIIFRIALEHRASAIILCHNHPSGSSTPSPQDVTLTKQLLEGGRLLQIYVGDHVIIGGEKYYSFADNGLIYR